VFRGFEVHIPDLKPHFPKDPLDRDDESVALSQEQRAEAGVSCFRGLLDTGRGLCDLRV
jgi:hypothetical protein